MLEEPKGALTIIVNAIIAFLSQIHSFLRFGLFILFCLSIWLLNDSTEFIRDYRISNKIENVKNIEAIINNPKIDTTTKRMLKSMENQIIQRESLLERLYLFFDEIQYSDKTVSANAGIEQKPITTNTSLNKGFISSKFKFFLHIFSSSWIGILTFLFCIFWAIKDRKINIKPPLIVMLLAFFNIIAFSLITTIFPKSKIELINYLINALFYTTTQLVLLVIFLPKITEHREEILSTLKLDD